MSIPAFDNEMTEVAEIKQVPIKSPRGMREKSFDRVIEAATQLYQSLNGTRLPSIDELAAHTGLSEKVIIRVLTSHEFLMKMDRRGILWTNKKRVLEELTPEQAATIAVITDPTLKMDLRARLKRVGVPYVVYRNWLRNPAFARVVKTTAEMSLEDHLPDFHTKIVERGLGGDLNAIKFAYELTGRHDPAKQQMVDLNRMVMLLLEVITKHIRDPIILNQINMDVDLILKGKTPAAIDILPANYVESPVVEAKIIEDDIFAVPDDFFELETDERQSP